MHAYAVRHYVSRHRRRRARLFYGDFAKRKAERTRDYFRYAYGWVLHKCVACNGSGHYDHDGAPACGACNGSGKCREQGPKSFAKIAALKAEGAL